MKSPKVVGKSSRRCVLAEVSGTFWNLSLAYKICSSLYILIGLQRNTFYCQTDVQLCFYDKSRPSKLILDQGQTQSWVGPKYIKDTVSWRIASNLPSSAPENPQSTPNSTMSQFAYVWEMANLKIYSDHKSHFCRRNPVARWFDLE